MNTKKNGISLIVLVITIIVMIILATAIILSLNGSGIITKANEAVTKSDNANAKYVVSLAKAEWEMMTNEEQDEAADSLKEYVEDKLNEAGFKDIVVNNKGEIVGDTYTIYTDTAKKTAPIPEGFTVSTLPGETTIAGGLVIYEGTAPVTNVDSDSNGIIDAQETRNQFVWVPVDDYSKFERTTTYKEEEGITDPDLENNIKYAEPFSKKSETDIALSLDNDPTGEWKEEKAMRESVEENGGFYIGRYEAGTTVDRETAVGTTKVVIQKGQYVYNYVRWGESMTDVSGEDESCGFGAVVLSRNMYKTSSSVKSTLCYGVQWDAALRFITTNSEHVDYPTDSDGKGNYSGEILSTGSSEDYKANNIYDMAGNLFEWTMEACTVGLRVIRGGDYDSNVNDDPACIRRIFAMTHMTPIYMGFRITLYIK